MSIMQVKIKTAVYACKCENGVLKNGVLCDCREPFGAIEGPKLQHESRVIPMAQRIYGCIAPEKIGEFTELVNGLVNTCVYAGFDNVSSYVCEALNQCVSDRQEQQLRAGAEAAVEAIALAVGGLGAVKDREAAEIEIREDGRVVHVEGGVPMPIPIVIDLTV